MENTENKQQTVQETPAPEVETADDVISQAEKVKSASDEELKAKETALKAVIESIPEDADAVYLAALNAAKSELELVTAELESRATAEVKKVETETETFVSKYGSKINEGAKWAVLAAIVYRLFIF